MKQAGELRVERLREKREAPAEHATTRSDGITGQTLNFDERIGHPMTSTRAEYADAVGLSLIALRVTDLRRSIEFYTAGCGFVEQHAFSTDDFDAVILRAGSAGIELLMPRDPAWVPNHGDMFVKLILDTVDVAGLLARACSNGGTEETPATVFAVFGNRVIGTVRDPDGYLIEIVGPCG